jgi:hypothetical protein
MTPWDGRSVNWRRGGRRSASVRFDAWPVVSSILRSLARSGEFCLPIAFALPVQSRIAKDFWGDGPSWLAMILDVRAVLGRMRA